MYIYFIAQVVNDPEILNALPEETETSSAYMCECSNMIKIVVFQHNSNLQYNMVRNVIYLFTSEMWQISFEIRKIASTRSLEDYFSSSTRCRHTRERKKWTFRACKCIDLLIQDYFFMILPTEHIFI